MFAVNRMRFWTVIAVCWIGCISLAEAAQPFPLRAKRILFLGDSITHSGQYVTWVETQLRLQGVDPVPNIVNIGLSSETVCGLTEKGHPFPRPNVLDRLDRALELVKPDVVVACYGMNDGIYHPFSEERFKAYRDGIDQLIEKSHDAGTKVILLTPPPFDPMPLREKGILKTAEQRNQGEVGFFEGYDDVLTRYADWILKQRDRVEMVVDVHKAVLDAIKRERQKNATFSFTKDGVHPNAAGHRVMGNSILRAWNIPSNVEPTATISAAMSQRGSILHDAWLSHVGHSRPGVRAGLPLPEAIAKAEGIEKQIAPLVAECREPKSSHRKSTGGTIHEIHFPASAKPNELRISADYFLWIPDDIGTLRGIIVHQHGCGSGAAIGGRTATDDLHWQSLARKWDCALMGSGYEPRDDIQCWTWCDPRRGSGDRFIQALTRFSKSTGHSELASVPWCLWGHSGGGFWTSLMQTKYAERIVAIWLRSGTAFGQWTGGEIDAPEISDAVFGVPVMANPGLKEKDDKRFGRLWKGLADMRDTYRERGSFFQFAPDPNTGHECGDSRYLAIPYFDFWLKHRLPNRDDTLSTLKPVAAGKDLWHGTMSAKMGEYMLSGSVNDTTPPPAPASVSATRSETSVTVSWEAEADFESGIQCFLIDRDGTRIGQVPEKPLGRFGRPLFQTLSYHDTPEAPLPIMQFIDKDAPTTHIPNYQVRTVNSVGLESEPTSSK